jgi:hypothetical protein
VQVEPVGPIELVHDEPWSTVLSVPLADGLAWFKACAPLQAFEPRLSAELFARWPDRVAEVLAHDEERAWLLLADAGTPISVFGNPPEAWLALLPGYAELQRGESPHAQEHLEHGVPDMRLDVLPARLEHVFQSVLPLDPAEVQVLRAFLPRFAELCAELAGRGIPVTVQHDDLHMANVYEQDGHLRVLDWGDSSIAHPFFSLYVTFRFLESVTKLPPGDRWFNRLRDAYLEPWGDGHSETFALALRIAAFAHVIAWKRQRDHVAEKDWPEFDPEVPRRALAQTIE